ncbi:MAG: cation transporter [Gammaproteobacteria bacterium]|nr:cation transporter [Gammaproteobacteria bacterium]
MAAHHDRPHRRTGHGPHAHDPAPGHGGHEAAFRLAFALNAAFVLVELGAGFVANSTALVADAGHNLSDVLGLLLAWGAMLLSKRAPAGRFTYGLRSTSILAALGNAALLLIACGAIAWEAAHRLFAPPPVSGTTVTVVALVGIVVNGVSARLFARGRARDLNVRGVYLHMLADAMVSLGVAVAGLVVTLTGWLWLDPAVSLGVVAVIVAGAWSLLREALHLALSAVPTHVDLTAIEAYLRGRPGVTDIHDLHVWGMSTTETALTAHLVIPGGYPGDAFMDDIVETLEHEFEIHHATLQIEQGNTNHACALRGAP